MASQLDNRFILIGKVVRTQGIKGKLKVWPLADPDLFFAVEGVHLGKDEEHTAYYKVTASQLHKGSILLGLDGVETVNKAEELIGSHVFTETKTLEELPDGEYYWFQILGLDVVTEDGRSLGKIKEILPTGSNDVYVVRDGSKEYLIPAIEEVVKDIDLSGRRMLISPMKGLLEEE